MQSAEPIFSNWRPIAIVTALVLAFAARLTAAPIGGRVSPKGHQTLGDVKLSKILKFPPTKRLKSVLVRSSREHRIRIEIRDESRPRRTRWVVQFEIQEVAGFRGSKGLTDRAVANGYCHRFTVKSTYAARRLAIMMAPLIASGKIALWIDGTMVRPQPALAA